MDAPESRSSSNRRVGLAISRGSRRWPACFYCFFVSSLHRGRRFFRRVYARYYKFSFAHFINIVFFARIAASRWRLHLASPFRHDCPPGWWPQWWRRCASRRATTRRWPRAPGWRTRRPATHWPRWSSRWRPASRWPRRSSRGWAARWQWRAWRQRRPTRTQ